MSAHQCGDAAAGQTLQSAPLPVATPDVPHKPVIIERPVTPDKLMELDKPAAPAKPVVPEQPPVPVPESAPSPVKTTDLEMPSAGLSEPESKHHDVVME